jgi:anaerobic selenocysteine-containing dehydrogenase
MSRGEVKGLFLIGQNPAAGAPNGKLNRAALAQLDWLVVRDSFEHESANFWCADPSGVDPSTIKTEIFFLPAATNPEKDGTFTNTERLIQFHEKAVDPPGACRSDANFIFILGKRLKQLYKDSSLKRDGANQNLTWIIKPVGRPLRSDYPIVATTYRLTEHYLSGPMSRFNSWLNELQPQMFVEMSPELAAQRGIEHSGWCTVITPRAKIEARAMVTGRLKPL